MKNGFYRIAELPLGPKVVIVRADGFEPERKHAFIEPGEPTRCPVCIATDSFNG